MPHTDPDISAAYKRCWAHKHSDVVRESQSEWKKRNPEIVRAQARKDAAKRRARDPEGTRAQHNAWRTANKDRLNKERSARLIANPELRERTRDQQHKNKYGISLAERAELFARQGSVCAACGSSDPRHKLGWQLDHDHKTHTVRGVLCHPCNLSLGHAKECPSRLRALADYIERHK